MAIIIGHNRDVARIGPISRVVYLKALMYVCMIRSENDLQKIHVQGTGHPNPQVSN